MRMLRSSMNIQNFILVTLMWALASSDQVIEVHPRNATVLEGDDHHLQCRFKEIIRKCTWLGGKGDPIGINARYEYLDSTANGENTTNCSIVIRGFSTHDVHGWRCSYIVSDYESPSDNAKSDKAYLTIDKRKPPIPDISILLPANITESSTDINMINVLVIANFGQLLMTVALLVVIFCLRRKKAKKKEKTDSTWTITTPKSQSRLKVGSLSTNGDLWNNYRSHLLQEEQMPDSQPEEIFMSIDEIM